MFFMKFNKKLLLLAVVFLTGQSIYGDGLPGENLVTQRWRDLIANHSPLTNAAILTEENYPSLRLAVSPILQGEFLHGELGVNVPIGLYQTVGATFVGELDGYVKESGNDADGRLNPDISGNTTSNNDLFIMLTYAYNVWNRLSVGVNVNYAIKSNFGEPLTGLGLDLGVTYRLLKSAVFGDHLIGIATQNLIAPQMTRSLSLSFDNQEQYSRDLRFTWYSYYMEHRLESTLDFNLKDFLSSAKGLNGESFNKLEWDLNYKVGVWVLKLLRLYLQAGIKEDGWDYLGMALGVNIPGVNNGRDLEVLYQFDAMTQKDNDATSHTVYLRVDMGKHREEVYSRKMARLASLSPNDLYNKARKLYAEEKYWDAFFVFSRLYAEYPDFFKSDWVQYFRASCQEHLDMRDAAIRNYEQMKKDYPLSSATPYSDLGLMRVFYRSENYQRATNEYSELTKPNVPDSLKFHGTYLMGETYLQQNNPAQAIEVLSQIPDGHPDYAFAQHAIAISHAKLDHETSLIVSALENCVGTKVQTEAQKEIINRSYLFLGYIFFEENTLSKAIVALRMVPTTSYYAEDALLGQGWTSLKARQWIDCISVGQMLAKSTNKDALKCEGMLIESYGHLLQKEYMPALNLLTTAVELIHRVKTPDKDSLNYIRMQYESDRMGYNGFADNLEKVANAGQTFAIVNQIDSLHTSQGVFVKKFKDFYKFSDEFGRTTFFSRNAETIKDDIEYALATVQKIVGQKGLQKEKDKIDDKQKGIDSEIEKLKNEMNKLQEKAK